MREADDGELEPARYPDGDPVYRCGWNDALTRRDAMADADDCAERDPDARFVVLDPSGSVVYEAAPGIPVPF
jgi:hypothetical protein